jgi:hypothetical protein
VLGWVVPLVVVVPYANFKQEGASHSPVSREKMVKIEKTSSAFSTSVECKCERAN